MGARRVDSQGGCGCRAPPTSVARRLILRSDRQRPGFAARQAVSQKGFGQVLRGPGWRGVGREALPEVAFLVVRRRPPELLEGVGGPGLHEREVGATDRFRIKPGTGPRELDVELQLLSENASARLRLGGHIGHEIREALLVEAPQLLRHLARAGLALSGLLAL